MRPKTLGPNISNLLLSWGLVLFFSYDFMAKIMSLHEISHVPYQWATGVKYCWLALMLSFRKNRSIENKIIWIPIAIGLCVTIGMWSLHKILTPDDFLFNGYYYLAHSFPMLLLAFFAYFENDQVINRFIKVFKIFLALNSVLILLNLMTDFAWALTYFKGSRFGHQGVLLYHAESAYIYFLGVALFLFEFRRNQSKVNLLLLILNIAAALLLGTKKSYMLIGLLTLYVLYQYRRSVTMYIISAVTAVMVFVSREVIDRLLSEQFKVLYRVYENDGLLSMLLSYRNELFLNNTLPFIRSEWKILNVLFGGPKLHEYRSEMELVDLFLFVGIAGILLYAIWFYWLNKLLVKTVYGKYLLLCLIATALLSGNLLASINTSIIFFFVQKRLNKEAL